MPDCSKEFIKRLEEDEKLKELLCNITIQESSLVKGWLSLGGVHFHPDGEFANICYKHLRNYIISKFNDMQVKVINLSKNDLPRYETKNAAGLDVRADLSRTTPTNPIKLYGDGEIIFKGEGHTKTLLRLEPGSRALIPTGLFTAIPNGYEIQVRPRSGLALKKGLTVLNTPGTIDADYRGEIGIILVNLGLESIWLEDGERIAQIVLKKVEKIEWDVVEELDSTERGEGGFGHTNTK